jgi:hypothetical protein
VLVDLHAHYPMHFTEGVWSDSGTAGRLEQGGLRARFVVGVADVAGEREVVRRCLEKGPEFGGLEQLPQLEPATDRHRGGMQWPVATRPM